MAGRQQCSALAVLLLTVLSSCVHIVLGRPLSLPPVAMPASSAAFRYEGRWEPYQDPDQALPAELRADWPCSRVSFGVQLLPASQAAVASGGTVTLPVLWYGERVRVNATVRDPRSGQVLAFTTLVGPPWENPFAPLESVGSLPLALPPGSAGRNVTVTLSKATTSAPFGTGIGGWIVKESMFRFFGLGTPGGADGVRAVVTAPTDAPPRRRMVSIGASDTAGYCVDGPRGFNVTIPLALGGWKYENCNFAYPSVVARALGASLSVQAISGIGLTQNSNANLQWVMGSLAMPGYFNRTLQWHATPEWNFTPAVHAPPDLVTVSLGGNDYNHQAKGYIPTNASFTAANVAFFTSLFDHYYASASSMQVVAVCGMGCPLAVKKSPNNNRCRPCPHVEAGVAAFKRLRPELAGRLHFVFVPCDGSVLTGNGDIGCDGHKNRAGQAKVARFLTPRLAAIMGW